MTNTEDESRTCFQNAVYMKYTLKMDYVQHNNYWYDRFTTSGLKLRQDFI